MTKPALMAGSSRFAHLLGGRRRRAADGNDEGEDYGNRKDGRKAEEDDEGDDEDQGARKGRKAKRAEDDNRDDDDHQDNARKSKRADDDGDDDGDMRKGRKAKRADDDDGYDEADDGDDEDARKGRKAKRARAEDDDDDGDDEDEREMNGHSAAAAARRRERARCCAILEAAADTMGNPAVLETALTQMEGTRGAGHAVSRVKRAARMSRDQDRSDARSSLNPRVAITAPSGPSDSAAAAKGWGDAIAKVVGPDKR
ncbi:hypothetical protein [Novosphingobium sp. FSW06-99]|uniref:hypothetical protein n=1 Tax=Novosphingobium sp. FSW06-99 TaxID=1739113 RepID=UPI00076C437D|nr:hypothetical protein [Novosphingobium sp. FSW06-99]KUR80764.1 hypothetical protein AQZ49_01680 [Novosphingobium sp. FSW06-99]